MATVSLLVETSDTTNTPNASGSFSPTSGSLLVVISTMTGTTATTPSCTSSIGGFTFSNATFAFWPAVAAQGIYMWVADALVSNTASQTVTIDDADTATGTNIVVIQITGMTKTGLSAFRQIGTPDSDNSPAATPTVPFAGACLTGNPVIGAVGATSITPPYAITEPSGFSELSEIEHDTPDTGQQVSYVNSGFTGSTLTWGSTFAGNGGAIAVELDASASAENRKRRTSLMGVG